MIQAGSASTTVLIILRDASEHSSHANGAAIPKHGITPAKVAATTEGGVGAVHEAVNVGRAMRMVTIDAAHTLGVEERVGTIETGEFADFAVMETDPQEVDPSTIKDIGVVATILGGRVTASAETRDPPAECAGRGLDCAGTDSQIPRVRRRQAGRTIDQGPSPGRARLTYRFLEDAKCAITT